MQYQIPQFIELEDKIIGPLTLKQFGYLAIGFFICFGSFFIFIFKIWLGISVITIFISLIFAFFSFNGRPFMDMITSYIKYARKPHKIKKSTLLELDLLKESIKPDSISDLNISFTTSKQPIKNEASFIKTFINILEEKKDRYEIIKKITGEKEIAENIDY